MKDTLLGKTVWLVKYLGTYGVVECEVKEIDGSIFVLEPTGKRKTARYLVTRDAFVTTKQEVTETIRAYLDSRRKNLAKQLDKLDKQQKQWNAAGWLGDNNETH